MIAVRYSRIVLAMVFCLTMVDAAWACHVVQVTVKDVGRAEEAYAEYNLDGKVRGGTSAPGKPGTEQQRTLTPEENAAVWSAVGVVAASFMGKIEPAPAVEYVSLDLVWDTGQKAHLAWPARERHPDERVQDLFKILRQQGPTARQE